MRAWRLGLVAVWVALAAALVSVWSVEYFPTQDGPGQLELAASWGALNVGSEPHSTYLVVRPDPVPYWSAGLVSAGLLEVLDPVVAHKVIVTLLVSAFTAAAWYAMSAVRRNTLAVLAVPFATGWYLHKGFFNFVAAVCLFLVIVGFWMRHGRSPTISQTVALSLLMTGTYFSHLVPLGAAWVVVGVLVAAWAAEGSDGSFLARSWRIGRYPLLASLPSLLLAGRFLLAGSESGVRWGFGHPLAWLRRAATLYFQIVSFDEIEWALTIALAVLVTTGVVAALVLKVAHRRLSWDDGLLAAAALLTLAAYLAPLEAAGGSLIRERVALFPALVVLVWLGGQDLGRGLETMLIVGGLAVALALVGVHVRAYRLADREIREVVSASEWVGEGVVILPVSLIDFTDPNYLRVRPLLHAPSWVALHHGGINLGNPWPSTHFSPVRFREDLDPALHLLSTPTGFHTPPPRGDISGYEDRTGTRIDYVLVIGLDREPGFEAENEKFLGELEERFDLVYRSEPSGLVMVFEHS